MSDRPRFYTTALHPHIVADGSSGLGYANCGNADRARSVCAYLNACDGLSTEELEGVRFAEEEVTHAEGHAAEGPQGAGEPVAPPGARGSAVMSGPVWIAVGKALPAPQLDVLVHYCLAWESEECGTIDLAYRKLDGRWVLTGEEPEIEIRPTHWMPLPPPPAAAKRTRAAA